MSPPVDEAVLADNERLRRQNEQLQRWVLDLIADNRTLRERLRLEPALHPAKLEAA